ncbi:PAS domain-containing protein [Altericroceibacterium spongiae]|uniref:histidine kinase n=1 Tax=Altericroceibacterium spongiae TaxID=2320269 RepID=A0A420EF61_9SPHN|nr:PAS domain-containing sensor histidine kinase [Altericroceibacterium spongiae]RKF19339.1 PAS domain-containing protein [Altericroceibacterium spongiae]
MEFSPTALVLLGLFLAAWTIGAAFLALRARMLSGKVDSARRSTRRFSRILDECPAVPLLVRPDGRIEAPERLAAWLGLDSVPGFLSELDGQDTGLSAGDLKRLSDAVRRTHRTGTPFQLVFTPRYSRRNLAVRGQLADAAIASGNAALLWWFDFSESHEELASLRAETARARGDFAALVGLIEAAPMPMWFRRSDARLQLVNSAYVEAVGARDAEQVVAEQIELIEPIEGISAAQIARQAQETRQSIERIVSATLHNQRRTMRVSDLPLGHEGVAGYAVDIEDMEEQNRIFRAFREAQVSLLDQLSVGVAQFDSQRQLTFANQPFQRLFELPAARHSDVLEFDRFLDMARDKGRLPETRDFPQWRREMGTWFTSGAPQEDAWTLNDGTHLRIIAQPMPDGGLVMIAEDQSEQLALSATRDTLLRTRTATFDSLFESLAVFAPDGRLQLWNRRFAAIWGLPEGLMDDHPRIEALLEQIGSQLVRPAHGQAIGEAVRAATLDRRQRGGQVRLTDGRTLEFAGVPLPDGNGLLTILDVTDSRKAEDALRERNAALEEADAVKTRFLANMSYEFRTPLTSISGFAELLQSGMAGELSDQAKEYVEAILTSVERLSGQIESVLDLTQSEAGLLPIATEDCELLPFLTELVHHYADALEEKHIALDLRADRSAGTIKVDKRRLNRAMSNLLNNALAATPENGRILVSMKRQKGAVRIVVSDNGCGMRPGELARALDGYQLDADGQPEKRRTGLGLPLARQLIEAHGGRLEMISEPGAGTTATITLPVT